MGIHTWDESKRERNFAKHRLDLADAHVVYENPEKITFSSPRNDENRDLDIAFVRLVDTVLTLVYQLRGEDVHVISFRYASRKEGECMSNSETKSRTDWEYVKRTAESDAPIPYDPEDGPYDPNDEGATEAYLSTAIVRRPGQRGPQKSATKEMISIRLSREVLEYFRGTGEGWQGRIDDVLKRYASRASRKH
jgi:uncharacterized DUF497 family protein/uncharacterized protein (DUF4415 family)